MVLVSKSAATDKKGKIKKGYKSIETKNGRTMYFTDDKAKKPAEKVDKPKKAKPSAKQKANNDVETDTVVEFE